VKTSSISVLCLEFPLVVVLVGVALPTGGSFDEALRYAAFHAVFVVLPAFALGRAAFPSASAAGQVALAGPAAYGALVLCGTAGIVLHLPAVAFLSPLLALAWLLRSARGPSVGADPDAAAPRTGPIHAEDTPPPLLGATATIFLIASGLLFLLFAWPSRAPTESLAAIHFHDNIWTLGNTRSLLNWGLPLRDIRVDGFSLGYHLGQNVVQSVAVRFFGLDPFGVMFRLEPFGTLHLLVAGLTFGPSVALRSRAWVGPLLASLLLLTDGRGLGLYQTSYWNPVSFAVSVGPFVVFQLVLVGYLEKQISKLPVLLLSLCFLMMGATKGILLGFVPLALAVTIGVRFVRRRTWRAVTRAEWSLAAGLLFSLIFLAKTMFAAVGSTGLATRLAVEGKTGLAAVGVVLGEALRTGGEVVSAGMIVPLIVGSSLLYPHTIRGLWRREAVVYVAALVVSMIGFWSVLRLGGAIFYFRWYPALSLSLLAPLLLNGLVGERGEPSAVPEARTLRGRALAGWSLVVVALGIGGFVRHSLPLLAGPAAPPLAGRQPWSAAASVDRGEWEAMHWLEQHAARDDRFFSDRHTLSIAAPPQSVLPAFFAYSALSGRQAIADGSSFSVPRAKPVARERWRAIQAFLASPTSAESTALLRTMGARWFVQSRRFDHQDFRQVAGLTLRHENPSVRIYEVTPSDSAPR
jgi:hypothetical protein